MLKKTIDDWMEEILKTQKDLPKVTPVETTCSTCVGYGIWAIGDAVPMYPLDASDGMPTKACPECGANANG